MPGRLRSLRGLWGLAAVSLTLWASSCASATGWQRTDSRHCQADGPPRICVDVTPDRAVVFVAGGVELVPGECAEAPEDTRGGSLRISVRDGGSPGGAAGRRVHVRRGRELHVTVAEPLKLRVADRARCEQ